MATTEPQTHQTTAEFLSAAALSDGEPVLTDVVEKKVFEKTGFGIENKPPEMKKRSIALEVLFKY